MRAMWFAVLAACSGGQSAPIVSVAPTAAPVDVVMVVDGEFDESWELFGVVRSKQHARVSAQVAGEIRTADVFPGDVVEQGDVLVRIDDALVKARMEAARAKWSEAKGIAEANRTLRNNLKAVAGGPTMAAEAAKASAKASEHDAIGRAARAYMETISVDLVRHEVKAPFRGLVSRRHVDVGDTVFAGDVVLDLVSLGEVEVWVDAPAAATGGIEPGTSATLEGEDRLVGEILAVVPVIDEETQTILVRILPSEPRPWLMAGARVGVRLPVTTPAEGRVVPKEALLERRDGDFVVSVVDSRAVHLAVNVLARNDDSVLLGPEGLEAGDEVIVRGHDRLRSGQLLALEER